MISKLWNDIQLVYENYFKNESVYIDNTSIISIDNYYLIHYIPEGKNNIRIKIEKDYNLVTMWGGGDVDITNYKISVESNDKTILEENYKIELAYKIIKPFLREIKLNKIGI